MTISLKRAVCTILALTQLAAFPVFAANHTGDSATAQNSPSYTDAVKAEQAAAQKAGISMEQVDALIDMGYIPEEIEKMTSAQVDALLTKDLNATEEAAYYRAKASAAVLSVAAAAPSGYTYVATVPDGGGSDEWFEPYVDTTEDTIDDVVAGAKYIAQTIFDTTASYSTIRYAYYLCGEWGEDSGREKWCHEGIDMKHGTKSTASVYSPISGYVSKSSTSNKYVNIYNDDLGITVNIQHLNNLDGTGKLVEGSYVEEGQYLGNQNTTDGHVHLQVCTHTECTQVHSGRDLDLICERPDWYLY